MKITIVLDTESKKDQRMLDLFFMNKPEGIDKLDKDISELKLDTRSYNALYKSGIRTIDDLQKTIDTIDLIKGFGSQSTEIIEEKLKDFLQFE